MKKALTSSQSEPYVVKTVIYWVTADIDIDSSLGLRFGCRGTCSIFGHLLLLLLLLKSRGGYGGRPWLDWPVEKQMAVICNTRQQLPSSLHSWSNQPSFFSLFSLSFFFLSFPFLPYGLSSGVLLLSITDAATFYCFCSLRLKRWKIIVV